MQTGYNFANSLYSLNEILNLYAKQTCKIDLTPANALSTWHQKNMVATIS